MKRKFKKATSIILAAVILLCSAPLSGLVGLELPDLGGLKKLASSISEFFDGIKPKAEAAISGYYTYSVWNGEAEITHVDNSIGSDIVIPSTLGGYPVTSINIYAFDACDSLKSITIPDSVTSINGTFFYGYGRFTDLYYTGDLEGWCEINFNNNPMRYAENLYINGTLLKGDIVIPDSVTKIGNSVFEYCSSLRCVTIPDSVTSIGQRAFGFCENLTSLTIPDSVTYIGFGAFWGCSSITSLTIPDSVSSIGSSAFHGCTSLTSITIPDSVTSISFGMFSDCSKLRNITIPDSVTEIWDGAFSGCGSLADVYYSGTESEWNAISIGPLNEPLLNATIHFNSASGGESSELDGDFLLNPYFRDFIAENKYYEKRTKRANKMPIDKTRFLEAIIGDELDYAPADKAVEIKDRIYNLFYVATYRAEFGEDRSGIIEKWPSQNSGSNTKQIEDDGLGQVVKWDKNPCRGCRSYARFCSQYIYGNIGSCDKKINSLQNSNELKDLVLNYVDPGEAIHYYYMKKGNKSEHWVVYVGSDSEGFYFLTYEGGKGKYGTYHDINLEYVTYERLANSCKGLLIEVSDTNNGSYRKQTAENSVHKSTTVELSINVSAKVYVDGVLKHSSSARSKTSSQANMITITFLSGEKHDIKIVGDSAGTFDYKVSYIMSDGKQNTREFVDVPINKNYTVTTLVSNCYEQDYLSIDKDGDNQEDEVWSAAMNEVADTPYIEDELYDSENLVEVRKPSTTTIIYGDSIILHAEINDELPEGYYVEWTASNNNFSYTADGATCEITPEKSGDTTFTATIYDADGNPVSTDEQTMTSKAGFFQKIIAFFKGIFGLNKTYPNIFKF